MGEKDVRGILVILASEKKIFIKYVILTQNELYGTK